MSTPPTTSDSGFASPLVPQFARFLALKDAMGYRYREEGRVLHDLDRFLNPRLSATDLLITPAIVHDYVARRGTESETTRAHRLTLIREVCRFLRLDYARVVVPAPVLTDRATEVCAARAQQGSGQALPAGVCSTATGASLSHAGRCPRHRVAPSLPGRVASWRTAAAYASRPRSRHRRAAYPSQQVQQIAGGTARTRSVPTHGSVPHRCGALWALSSRHTTVPQPARTSIFHYRAPRSLPSHAENRGHQTDNG